MFGKILRCKSVHSGQFAHGELLPGTTCCVDWPSAYNERFFRVDRVPRWPYSVELEHQSDADRRGTGTLGSGMPIAGDVSLVAPNVSYNTTCCEYKNCLSLNK